MDGAVVAVVERPEIQKWRSVRPGKINWTKQEVEDLAAEIHVNLPPSMLAVFEDPKYKGGALLGLPQSGTLKTPTANEISLNYPWLVGMVTKYPSKVPSAYLLTDAFLLLDKRMQKKLFRPSADLKETRMGLAAIKAVKAKRILGALRALWRSSPQGGHDQRITYLKSFLVASPRGRPGRAAEAPEAPEPEPVADESEREDDGDEGSEADDGDHRAHGDGDDGALDGRDGDGNNGVACPPSSPCSERGASSDGLSAPTLRLDDCRASSQEVGGTESDSSESESSFQESQVPGAGWMGKAMMKAREVEREEKAFADLERVEMEEEEDRLNRLLASIKEQIEFQLESEDSLDGILWDAYEAWSYDALKTYGEDVIEKLSQASFFQRWVREQKASPHEDLRHAVMKKWSGSEASGASSARATRGSDEVLVTPAAKRPKLTGDVAKGLQITPPPIVGQQTAKRMSAVKAEDKLEGTKGHGEPMTEFHGFDLVAMGIPINARPLSGDQHFGRLGYTIRSRTGAVVECLLKQKAFVLKKCAENTSNTENFKKGQVSWNKFGGVEPAWTIAKERSGF